MMNTPSELPCTLRRRMNWPRVQTYLIIVFGRFPLRRHTTKPMSTGSFPFGRTEEMRNNEAPILCVMTI